MADEIKKCIYCGKELVKYRDSYISGLIAGQHDAAMCLDCADGDGAKYIEGGYYERKGKTLESRRESDEATRQYEQDQKISKIGDIIGYGLFALCGIVTVIVAISEVYDKFS